MFGINQYPYAGLVTRLAYADDALLDALIFCFFFLGKEFPGIDFCEEIKSAHAGRLKYGKRYVIVVSRVISRPQDFLAGSVEVGFCIFAFHCVVEDGPYALSGQDLDGFAAVFNGLPAAKVLENRIADKSGYRQPDVQGRVGEGWAYFGQKVACDNLK